MSNLKFFTDIIDNSLFSNQRYLYGNLIPSFFGILISYSVIFTELPFQNTNLFIISFLGIMPFIIAFLSNRISRTIIFYFSNANSLYKREFKRTQNIIKEEFTSDTSKTLSKEQSFYVESEIIKVAYNEFKKCYNETFYAKSDSSELDEMRRRETLFLFAFFSELWVIIILVLSFIF